MLAALLMAALLGITALAIDVGRLYALRSEMQNAVDAAALAAAAELDGKPDARARAITAARDMLQHDSRFASVAALLGEAALPEDSFAFYCMIGSQHDPSYNPVFCENAPGADGRSVADNDGEAHYVRVTLDPAQATGRFRLQLRFLPVLSAVGVPTQNEVSVRAAALGGRNVYTCDVPPVMICDPFEGTGTTFAAAMNPGESIKLAGGGGGGFWAPGNFGFLNAPSGGGGAAGSAAFLANEAGAGCSSGIIATNPGVMANPMVWAINTRFGEYSGMLGGSWATNPPAPNVVDYPHDATFQGASAPLTKFGNGDWNFNAYWSAAHPGVVAPNGWSNLSLPSRWQVYNYEISSGQIPDTPTYDGTPNPAQVGPGSVANRRLIKIAVVSCGALSVTGASQTPISTPDGYAEVFFYRRAEGPPERPIWGEYVRWVDGSDDQYHIRVQLYE